jgi:divalent metal cation (Fe/Co/Zn/Cd) transporter
MILKASFALTKKAIDGLIDTNLPKEELQEIKRIVKSHPKVRDYHKLRTRMSGSKREIDIQIQINNNITIGKAHDIVILLKMK